MDKKASTSSPKQHHPRVHNEAIALYDMDADETLKKTGHIVIDSSLGVIVDPLKVRPHGRMVTQKR